MKKFLLPGILAALFLFLPLRSQAVPLDVPYQILVTTVSNTGVLVISTANFPSPSSGVNNAVASYQWCFDRITVSCASAENFSIFWATSAVTAGTTDYMVTTAAGVPFDANIDYREVYCAPAGQPVVTMKTSVVQSTVTVEGFLWKGWSP